MTNGARTMTSCTARAAAVSAHRRVHAERHARALLNGRPAERSGRFQPPRLPNLVQGVRVSRRQRHGQRLRPARPRPGSDGAARIAACWLGTYATRMGRCTRGCCARTATTTSWTPSSDANPDPQDAARGSGLSGWHTTCCSTGTYDEAPQLCRAWLEHADAPTIVAPFGVPAEPIADTIEAISCR